MKRLDWFLGAVFAAVLFLFPGCSKKPAPLIVLTTGEIAPFSTVDSQGQPIGFDVDLIKLVAKHLSRDVDIRCAPFTDIVKKVQSKQADIAIAAISITDERKALVDFSPPYHNNGFSLFLLESSPERVEELIQNNRMLGVRKGTYQEGAAKLEWVNVPNLFVKSFDNLSSSEICQKLMSGEVAAFILDADESNYLARKNDGFKVVPLEFNSLDLGIVTSKGSPYTQAIADFLVKEKEAVNALKIKWLSPNR
jgi:polar amino acid transport system substrate-binding protein